MFCKRAIRYIRHFIYTGELLTLKEGLRRSKNTVSVHLMKQLGDTEPVRGLVNQMGIDSSLRYSNGRYRVPKSPSICLGSTDLTNMEMTGAYTAFANNGIYNKPIFLLRIEDTDTSRNNEEATQAILDAFEWIGMEHDGEIEYQSKRSEIYAKYIQQLLDEGKAYRCYMSKDELDALREQQQANKERPRYDGRYRDFDGTPPEGIEPVIRIKAHDATILDMGDQQATTTAVMGWATDAYPAGRGCFDRAGLGFESV